MFRPVTPVLLSCVAVAALLCTSAAQARSPILEAFEAKGEALANKIARSDGSDFQALWKEVQALEDEVKAAEAKDPKAMRLNWMGSVFRRLGYALRGAKNRATAAQIAKDDARLRDGAVVKRIADLKPEDAYDLAKVARAFRETKPGDLAITTQVKGYGLRHFYQPAGTQHADRRHAAKSEDKEPTHGAYAMLSEGKLAVLYYTDPQNLPAGTPGLVWNELPPHDVAFVTIDGGVYRTNIQNLMNGLTKPDAWPRKPVHVGLVRADLEKLSSLGHLEEGLGEKIASLEKKYNRCEDRLWKAVKGKFEAIDVADIHPSTRENRRRVLREKVYARIDKRCRRFVNAFEKLWVAAIEARQSARAELLAKNRERLMEIVEKAQKR